MSSDHLSTPQLLPLFPMAPSNSSGSAQDNLLEVYQDFQQVQMSDINPPKVGMVFSSPEEAFQFYEQFSCKVGFRITKRTSHIFHGIKSDATFACNKNRPTLPKSQQEGNGSRSKGSGGTGCRAKIVIKDHLFNGCWSIEEVILKHNHDLSPGSVRLMRHHHDIPLVKKTGNKKQKTNASSTQKKRSASKMKQPEICAAPPQTNDDLFHGAAPQPNIEDSFQSETELLLHL